MAQSKDNAQSKLEQFLQSENLAQTTSHQPTQQPLPKREPVKHILMGSPEGVKSTIHRLHITGCANVSDWSALQPTGKAGEVMSIFIRQILMR